MLSSLTKRNVLPWLGWFVLSVATLFQFLLQTSTSVMIPDLENAFNIDAFSVSLLSSSFFYPYLFFQMPAGMLIDKVRPRRVMCVALIVLGFMCIWFARSHHLKSAILSRVMMGLFSAPAFVSAFYFAGRYLPERAFPLAGGLTETLGMLGGVVGEALVARSIHYFNWHNTLFILAAVAFLLSGLVFVAVRDDIGLQVSAESEVTTAPSIWQNLFYLISSSQAWINGLFCGLIFTLVSSFAAFWCVPFLMALYTIPLSQAADLSSVIFVGAAVGTPLIGWLITRLPKRRFLMFSGAAAALIVTLIVIYASPHSKLWMALFLFLLGLASGVYLLPFAVIRDITPAHMRGTAMGYINMMCILIGAPILQPLIGWLLQFNTPPTLHAYHQALMAIPVSLTVAMFLSWFVEEKPASL